MTAWPDDTALTLADLGAAQHEGEEDREASEGLTSYLDMEAVNTASERWLERIRSGDFREPIRSFPDPSVAPTEGE